MCSAQFNRTRLDLQGRRYWNHSWSFPGGGRIVSDSIVDANSCPHFGQTRASWLTRLAHLEHFAPVVKASANPMGPSKAPMPNHKHPFAPLLLATIAK